MKRIAAGILLFALFLFLAFNKHSKDDYRSYRSVLWADASGYHVYNPIWFIYGNNCSQMPDSVNYKTGTGFSFNENTKRIITKYTSGVAILQAPFFLTAHLLAAPLGFEPNGFSPIYHGAIMIAGALYGLLGLLFSFLFLKRFFSEKISLLTVGIFFLCTNLYYYTLDASGFLHVYSFFLIAAVTWLTTKIYETPTTKYILPFFFALSLAILIRPTNVVLLIFVLCFDVKTNFQDRLVFLKSNFKHFILPALLSLIVFIPQLIYWKQSYGSAIVYSYGDEGFSFLLNPKLILVWFSTNNGLFTYAPILIISVIGMITALLQKNSNGILILFMFLLTSYIFSSWWNYWFGCALGARSFVEYYSLFMYPFTLLLSQIKNKVAWFSFFTFCLICAFINMNIIYYYDGCFYGGEWDWNTYFSLVTD